VTEQERSLEIYTKPRPRNPHSTRKALLVSSCWCISGKRMLVGTWLWRV